MSAYCFDCGFEHAEGQHDGTDGQTVGKGGGVGVSASHYAVVQCGVCGGMKESPYILQAPESACKCDLPSAEQAPAGLETTGTIEPAWNMPAGQPEVVERVDDSPMQVLYDDPAWMADYHKGLVQEWKTLYDQSQAQLLHHAGDCTGGDFSSDSLPSATSAAFDNHPNQRSG